MSPLTRGYVYLLAQRSITKGGLGLVVMVPFTRSHLLSIFDFTVTAPQKGASFIMSGMRIVIGQVSVACCMRWICVGIEVGMHSDSGA